MCIRPAPFFGVGRRASARVRRVRKDAGEGTVSYVGVILLVATLAIAIATTGLGSFLGDKIEHSVCLVTGDDCEDEPTVAGQQGQPQPTASQSTQGRPQFLGNRPGGFYARQPATGAGQTTGGGTPCWGWECPHVDDPVAAEAPPWMVQEGTPCWGVECDYVEDPIPLDTSHMATIPWNLEPSEFDFESDTCVFNCWRFTEEIESRIAACTGGPLGVFRGATGQCSRENAEHELVRDIEDDLNDYLEEHPELREALEDQLNLEAALAAGTVPNPRITDEGLSHSFNRHAAQWFGRQVTAADMAAWRGLIERAATSRQIVAWSAGSTPTYGYLARIEGKYFFAQFNRATGELVTAFVPNQRQLGAILGLLGH